MNNNEAKKTILEAEFCFCKHGAYKDCHSGCKYREALDAAVKALSDCSEIPTGLTDCISRQAVIDLMMQKWGENFSGDDAMQESIDAIREMPSVTPQEPKTGHWDDIPKYKDIAWQCSECGHFSTMKHNFCPNCGCRMLEPQESEAEDGNDQR